jgi:hypothetical protein
MQRGASAMAAAVDTPISALFNSDSFPLMAALAAYVQHSHRLATRIAANAQLDTCYPHHVTPSMGWLQGLAPKDNPTSGDHDVR